MEWLLIVLTVLLALALIFLLLVKPGAPRETGMSAIYAHRGYHDGEHPENSLAAFRRAREHGLGVELDVQLTKDKKLVVFHDKNTRRMTGADMDVCDTVFEKLEELRLEGTRERIPLFSEALEALDGAAVICEIKTYSGNSDCEACPEICRLMDGYKGHIVIEAFSPFIVKWFRENRPDIIRGQLSQNFFEHGGLSGLPALALGNLMTNFMARPDFIAFNFEDSTPGLACARMFGPTMAAWTVRSRDELERAVQKGFGVFICEKFRLENALDNDGEDTE